MLYLPKGIRNHIEAISLQNEATMGKLLVEIVCKHAWENGFSCDHKYKKFSDKDHKARSLRFPVGMQNHSVWRCETCGMLFKRGARMVNGSPILEELGYPSVGFVEAE